MEHDVRWGCSLSLVNLWCCSAKFVDLNIDLVLPLQLRPVKTCLSCMPSLTSTTMFKKMSHIISQCQLALASILLCRRTWELVASNLIAAALDLWDLLNHQDLLRSPLRQQACYHTVLLFLPMSNILNRIASTLATYAAAATNRAQPSHRSAMCSR